MCRSLLAGFVLASVVGSNACAIDWVIIPGVETDGDLVCLDRDNISRQHENFTVWIKQFKKDGDYSKTFLEIDCAKNKTRVLRSIEYDKEKNLLSELSGVKDDWESIQERTPAKGAVSMVCKNSRKKKGGSVVQK
jgi:hypothetical protein